MVRRGFFKLFKKDAPAPAAGTPQVYTFRANDGEFDRYNDRLSVKGWDLKSYNDNGIVLYNHDAGDGGPWGSGARDVLPIGKGKAYVSGDALFVDVEFDQDDEFARKVERKIQKGILNAVSVRYVMGDGYKTNEKGGFDSPSQELLEISVVTIPGNQRAIRVKELADTTAEDALVEKIAKRVVEALTALEAEEETPAPAAEVAAPPAAPPPVKPPDVAAPAAPAPEEPEKKSAPFDAEEFARLVTHAVQKNLKGAHLDA